MFVLRCAFFLSIVYASIVFGSGALRSPHAFEAAVATETSGAARGAMARASDWCAERPTRCARDASRLTALVEMTTIEPVSGSDEVVLADADVAKAPLPVPDPRRRAARAVLTDAR